MLFKRFGSIECDEDGNPPPIDEQDDSDFDNPHDDLSDK